MLAFTKLSITAIVAILPLAANAASDNDRSITVRTDDINLMTISGQKVLTLRIDRAAREVCDFASDQLGHQVRKIERKCREDAKASAWATARINKVLAGR